MNTEKEKEKKDLDAKSMLSLPVNKKRLCVCVCVYNELNVPTDKVHVERKEDEEREKMLGSTSQSSAL